MPKPTANRFAGARVLHNWRLENEHGRTWLVGRDMSHRIDLDQPRVHESDGEKYVYCNDYETWFRLGIPQEWDD